MQKEKWREYWGRYPQKRLSGGIQVKEYHKIVSELINSYINKEEIIEVGCGTGITSLLTDDRHKKTLLDCDEKALNIARENFSQHNKKANFILADMFKIPAEDKSYDIVFNSGVIEHFSYSDRVKAIKEYKRILKNDGYIVLAYPNHYSIPYRAGYLLFNFLRIWPYPKEYKLYDLNMELEENDLVLEKRLVVANNMFYDCLKFNKILVKIFQNLDRIFKFEGYLTVLIIKNKNI